MAMASIPVSVYVMGSIPPTVELLIAKETTAQHINTFFRDCFAPQVTWKLYPVSQIAVFEYRDNQYRRLEDSQLVAPIVYNLDAIHHRNLLVVKYDIPPRFVRESGVPKGPLTHYEQDGGVSAITDNQIDRMALAQMTHVVESGILWRAFASLSDVAKLIHCSTCCFGDRQLNGNQVDRVIRLAKNLGLKNVQVEAVLSIMEQLSQCGVQEAEVACAEIAYHVVQPMSMFAYGDIFYIHQVKVNTYCTTQFDGKNDISMQLHRNFLGTVERESECRRVVVVVAWDGVCFLSQKPLEILSRVTEKQMFHCDVDSESKLHLEVAYPHRYFLPHTQLSGWSCSTRGDVVAISLKPITTVIHLCGVSNGWGSELVRKLLLYHRLRKQSDVGGVAQRLPVSKTCNPIVLSDYVQFASNTTQQTSLQHSQYSRDQFARTVQLHKNTELSDHNYATLTATMNGTASGVSRNSIPESHDEMEDKFRDFQVGERLLGTSAQRNGVYYTQDNNRYQSFSRGGKSRPVSTVTGCEGNASVGIEGNASVGIKKEDGSTVLVDTLNGCLACSHQYNQDKATNVNELAGPSNMNELADPSNMNELADPSNLNELADPSNMNELADPSNLNDLAGPSNMNELADPFNVNELACKLKATENKSNSSEYILTRRPILQPETEAKVVQQHNSTQTIEREMAAIDKPNSNSAKINNGTNVKMHNNHTNNKRLTYSLNTYDVQHQSDELMKVKQMRLYIGLQSLCHVAAYWKTALLRRAFQKWYRIENYSYK